MLGARDSPRSTATSPLVGGIHRWYQSERQTFKLSNKYNGFGWQAGPLFGRAISINTVTANYRRFWLSFQSAFDAYAADFRPRVRGGAISASAGMFHSRCSFQAMLIVRGRFLVRMSDARCREPSRRPRSACV